MSMYPFNLQIEPSELEAELEGEVNRRSCTYIKWVQQLLNRIMGLRLAVDGTMGPQTRSAIRSFQEKNGLPVTGIVGPDTERALMGTKDGRAQAAGAPQAGEPAVPPSEPRATSPAEPAAPPPEGEFEFEWETGKPAAPYQLPQITCESLHADWIELQSINEAFRRSVAILDQLVRQTPRDDVRIDDVVKTAKKQQARLKIVLKIMIYRTRSGWYLRNGCSHKEIAKVTCKVRKMPGVWLRTPPIEPIKKLRDQLVYWLRHSRGAYAKVPCNRL